MYSDNPYDIIIQGNGMWLFWVIDMIIPVTMVVVSFYYKKIGKSDISKISGFRTSSSMKSKENWKFAHDVASKYLKRVGLFLILYVIIIKIIQPLSAEYLSLVNNMIFIIAFIGITIDTNVKLEKHVR